MADGIPMLQVSSGLGWCLCFILPEGQFQAEPSARGPSWSPVTHGTGSAHPRASPCSVVSLLTGLQGMRALSDTPTPLWPTGDSHNEVQERECVCACMCV